MKGPTGKQLAFIDRLTDENGFLSANHALRFHRMTHPALETAWLRGIRQPSHLSRSEASCLIECLLEHGDDEYSGREAREEMDREIAEAQQNIPTRWRALLDREDVLILDTETTGLDASAEVIEVAAIDTTGKLRLSRLALPEDGIPSAASRIHGLTASVLVAKDAHAFPAVHHDLVPLLRTASVVLAWNASFDKNMLIQTAQRHGLTPRLPRVTWLDLQAGYQAAHPFESRRLDDVVRKQCPGLKDTAHRAEGDCRRVLAVMKAVVAGGISSDLPSREEASEVMGKDFNAKRLLRAAVWTVVIFTPIFFGPLMCSDA